MSAERKPEKRSIVGSSEHEAYHLLATTSVYELPPGPERTRAVLSRAKGIDWLIRNGLASEWPRLEPEKPPAPTISQGNPRGLKIAGSAKCVNPPPRPQLVCLDSVRPEEVDWLWPGRFARGNVSMIGGDPGVGKSTFIGALIAIVTSGGRWPDAKGLFDAQARPASVLVLQDEESLASAIRPRLDGFGADIRKVHFLTGVARGDSAPSGFSIGRDVDALEIACDQLGDVGLVLIDPLGSFLRGISGYQETETRELIAPLFAFAEKRKIAIVAVAHLTKDAERDIKHRISGTIALSAHSRMLWYLSKDPTDDRRRLLSLIKGNLEGKTDTAMAFSYQKHRMEWGSKPVRLDAQQVDNLLRRKLQDERFELKPTRGPLASEARKAKEFILNFLARGPAWCSVALDQAETSGIKESSFRKGLRRLVEDDCRVLRYQDEKDGHLWIRLADPKPATAHPPTIEPVPGLDAWLDDGGAVRPEDGEGGAL